MKEGKEFPFWGKDDLVLERTFCKSAGRRGAREEPDKTQENRLSAADRYVDQFVQQHWGVWSRDQDSIDLWLQRRSTTEECLLDEDRLEGEYMNKGRGA